MCEFLRRTADTIKVLGQILDGSYPQLNFGLSLYPCLMFFVSGLFMSQTFRIPNLMGRTF